MNKEVNKILQRIQIKANQLSDAANDLAEEATKARAILGGANHPAPKGGRAKVISQTETFLEKRRKKMLGL